MQTVRHIGNDENQTKEILDTLGLERIDQLMAETVPDTIRLSNNEIFEKKGEKLISSDSGNIVSRHMYRISSAN
jgi:glycine cleavage system pyridoxal-binding protein P